MNFAGFGLGFSQGFNNGINIGNAVNAAIKQKKIDDVREQGMEEAKSARASQVSGMIKDNGIGATATQPTAPTTAPGTRTGEMAPDTAEVQTSAVPMPTAVVSSPQAATDAAPAKPQGLPVAPTVAPSAPAPATPMSSAVPMSDMTGATNPAAAGITPPVVPTKKRFSVGDASFDTIEEARAHAEKSAPSITDYFMKDTVPKISQAYLDQGDPAKAEAWDKYARDKTSQRNMDTWAKAYRAANAGNMEKAADHVFELYKAYDDGVTPISKETVKDKAGNVTGFNVKLRDDATGEERSQFIDERALIEMGMSALSPPAMFEQAYRRQQSVDAARVANAAKAADEQRKLQNEVTLEGVKARYKEKGDARRADREAENITLRATLESANLGEKEKAKVQSKIDVLKDAGYDEDTIKGMLPAMLGAGDHKKTTDPTERRALIFSDLSKNDPKFARSTPEEQNAKVEAAMQVIYNSGRGDGAAPAKPSAQAATPAPQQRGVYVIDNKTGKTVLLDPVTRKPIQ